MLRYSLIHQGKCDFLDELSSYNYISFRVLYSIVVDNNDGVSLSQRIADQIIDRNSNKIPLSNQDVHKQDFIIFDFSVESFEGHLFDIIHQFSEEEKFPLERIILLSDNFSVQDAYEYSGWSGISAFHFPGTYCYHAEPYYRKPSIIDFDVNQISKAYMCLNRRVVDFKSCYRTYVSIKLLNEYSDQIMLSFAHCVQSKSEIKQILSNNSIMFTSNIIEDLFDDCPKGVDQLIKGSPFEVDMRILDNDNVLPNPHTQAFSVFTSKELYKRHMMTAMTISTETAVMPLSDDLNYPMTYVTEKTWRPMMLGHPVFIIGSPNTYRHLTQSGFVFNDDCIDLDFDNVMDPVERITRSLASLKKSNIHDMNKSALSDWHNENLEMLIHNRNLLVSGTFKDSCKTKIINHIKKLV